MFNATTTTLIRRTSKLVKLVNSTNHQFKLVNSANLVNSTYNRFFSSHSITNSSSIYNNYQRRHPFTITRSMATNSDSTTTANTNLRYIVRVLESIAPSSTAESWDNVGLLVEPSSCNKSIRHIFLTNDLTEPVLDEAIHVGRVADGDEGVGLVVSYHPPIFKPFKRLTQSNEKERIIIKAIENGIGIYSPHTSHDSLWGGVNDWILTAFNKGTITPLSITETPHTSTLQLFISKLPNRSTANELGRYIETVIGVDSGCIITVCTEESINGQEIVSLKCTSLKKSHLNVLVPKLTEEYPLYNLSIGPSVKVPHTGPGRLLKFDNPCPLDTLISQIKTHLNLDHIRVARPPLLLENMSSLAVCVGSGASVLRGSKADVYLTGEMSHHDLLDANSKGVTVLLCEHSNTERGFLQVLKTLIKDRLPVPIDVRISVSQMDKDPVVIV